MAKKSSTVKETKGSSSTPQAEQETASASTDHRLVAAGKRYDFSRPAPSEDQEERRGITFKPSYEDLRDNLSHTEARLAWRDGDRHKAYVREQMQRIHDDANLSDEGKREEVRKLLDANAPQIEQTYEAARNKLESAAESSYAFSVPFPDNKTLATTKIEDTSEMLAVQAETDALARRMENRSLQSKTRERSKDPRSKGIRSTSNSNLGELQAEFDAAMSIGGVEGKIRALAIQRYCESKGVALDAIVDGHRQKSHRGALQDATDFEAALFSVPKNRGLENPYDQRHNRRGARAVGAYSGGNTAVGGSGTPKLFQKKKRKPSWK